MKQSVRLHFTSLVFILALAVSSPVKSFGQILGWDTTGISGFGISPFMPSTFDPHIVTSGLVRGSAIGTSGGSAASCWGGAGGWGTTPLDQNSFYVTFQATPGYKVSLANISTATRRSNAGPSGCSVWYSIGGSPFVTLGSWTTTSTSGTTGTPNNFSLTGIAALQDIAAGTIIKFALVPEGSAIGNYYLTGATNSLKIEGNVEVAVDPLITPSADFLPSFGDVIVGNTSAFQSFTVDAEGLTSELTIMAPDGFEISTDNINWYPGTDIETNFGSLDDLEVLVRFKPTVVGEAVGDIFISSPGAETRVVTVSGNGINTGLSVSPQTINTLSYIEGQGPSSSVQLQSLISSGLNPASGNIEFLLDAENLTNYEMSLDGISWAGVISFPYSSADNNISNPSIFVRLKAGLPEGPVVTEQIAISGGGFTTSIALTGLVISEDMLLSQTFCYPATAGQLVAPESAFWFSVPSGGTALSTSDTIESGTYYVSLTGETGTRIAVEIVVNSLPGAPSAASQSFCQGALVSALTTISGNNIKWYATQSGGTELSPDTELTSGTYYASQTTGECESLRASVAVTLNPIPDAPTTIAQDQEFCNAATVEDLFPAPFAGTDTAPIIEGWPGLIGYGFTGQQWMSGGEGASGINYYFTNFTQTPTSIPVMTSIETITTFDQLKSITILAAAPNDVPSGINKNLYISKIIDGIEIPVETVVLSDLLTYYTINIFGLEGNVKIKIAKDPSMAVFQMDTLQFTFYQLGEGMNWYSQQTDGNPLVVSDELVSGTYYLSQTVGGCESTRTPVEISIQSPTQPQGEATQEFVIGETLADLDVTGTNIVWYDNAELSGTPLDASALLADGTTYYAVSVQGSCTSEVLAVTTDETLGLDSAEINGLKYYPNPVTDVLSISYSSTISSIQVYTISGQLLNHSEPNSDSAKMNMLALASGVYFLKVTSDTFSKTIRIIKQ
ncbi:Ig-like domain-containing protein [Flavobacterium silvaticum]|uniref:T9SS type A sorting domain-containing protein n=1 Tax=Flavobacterium silvaticum TaxID=1852020 RepID=A0A972FL60_9FLAO|nr:T9SS type A sorting domain-containing protein [Flavobacterium silvaticum]NMH27753.1 T9SS type A sorting domain-containing protein [Flavobacterium silvaticum]